MAVWGYARPRGVIEQQLLLDWLKSFLTVEEQDRLLSFHLGVSFSLIVDPKTSNSKETLACF